VQVCVPSPSPHEVNVGAAKPGGWDVATEIDTVTWSSTPTGETWISNGAAWPGATVPATACTPTQASVDGAEAGVDGGSEPAVAVGTGPEPGAELCRAAID
jgi:hypothetical protein